MRFQLYTNSFRQLPRCLLLPKVIRMITKSSSRYYKVITNRNYDDAINLLNTLQTPYKALKEKWDAGIKVDASSNVEMRQCLARLGYAQQDLDKLNIVHVAGTKGKGSTCAYVDSILSQWRMSHNLPKKVGLFTSPHLVAVRERIRINSRPIAAQLFAKYFFEVWDKLESAALESNVPFEKPIYFRYLTLMSYHTFIREGVDVAIYEVGIGGEYDCTNVVDCPAVTGISTLGIDHTFTLGHTIDKIAWQKAGIQKRGVPSFTVPQKSAALEVIKKRAEERGVESLNIVEQDKRLDGVKIQPNAPFQRGNASLAVSLAGSLLGKLCPRFELATDSLPKSFVDGLEKMVWRGRCEIVVEKDVMWYLDCAHTADSIKVAAKWYADCCLQRSGKRVLIFNQQGHREAVELLEDLFNAMKLYVHVQFDYVIFCPTVPAITTSNKDFVNLATDAAALQGLTMQKDFAKKWEELDPSSDTKIKVLPSLEDALELVRNLSSNTLGSRRNEVHALITGSVHLVGRALGALEGPDAL